MNKFEMHRKISESDQELKQIKADRDYYLKMFEEETKRSDVLKTTIGKLEKELSEFKKVKPHKTKAVKSKIEKGEWYV